MADPKKYEWLRRTLKMADYQVYTIIRNVSRSGMNRVITPVVFIDNKPVYITGDVADCLGWKIDKNYLGIKVSGCGMDMCFHLIYELSAELFGDGYKLHQTNL